MRALDKARLRLRSLFRRREVESELEAELGFHLDQLIEENTGRGLAPDEARKAALRVVGGISQFQDECRDMRRVNVIESFAKDVQYGLRTLTKNPGFTVVVAATMALGIGGVTAVFSVIQAVLLEPLPYRDSGQLVRLYQGPPPPAEARGYLTGPHFKQIRDHAPSFVDVTALYTYAETGVDFAWEGRPQRLRALRVSSEYFRTLGYEPRLGRPFESEDETGTRNVVLSDALWRSRFRSDPSCIGATVRLNAEPYKIVGVAPTGFEDPIVGEVDAWLPLELATATSRNNYFLTAIGRLRKGVSIEQARAELAALNQSISERWRNVFQNTLVMRPLKEDLVATSRRTLHLLFFAVVLVLLVACVNVANLALVRTVGRTRELAIRAALGSSGFRIARQLLVESLLISAIGGLLGLVLAVLGVKVLQILGCNAISRLDEVGFNPVMLGFAVLVTLATGITFGVAPAIRFARVHPGWTLREQPRSATGTREQGRLRSALAAAQIALALTLLVGAGVLMASFYRLQQVNVGFGIDRVLTFDLSLPAARYNAERRAAFQEELARRIEGIPGVVSAGGTSHLPVIGRYHSWGTRINSGPLAGTDDSTFNPDQRIVSGNFFAALAIPLLAGRTFDARDDARAPSHAVVSASFAHRAFPQMPLENVIGQRIAAAGSELGIIGVVDDVAFDIHGTSAPTVYHAHRQMAANRNWALTQVVATNSQPLQILSAIRAEVAALDSQLVVHSVAPMKDVARMGVGRERFALVLMGAFAIVALALAAVGLYGVLAYSVRQRTHEFGIRIALGATAADVRRLVWRQAAVVIGIGVAAGWIGALLGGRWLSSLIYDTSSHDPRVLAMTTLLLVAVALVSAWIPAWRASRVEPRIAMNEE